MLNKKYPPITLNEIGHKKLLQLYVQALAYGYIVGNSMFWIEAYYYFLHPSKFKVHNKNNNKVPLITSNTAQLINTINTLMMRTNKSLYDIADDFIELAVEQLEGDSGCDPLYFSKNYFKKVQLTPRLSDKLPDLLRQGSPQDDMEIFHLLYGLRYTQFCDYKLGSPQVSHQQLVEFIQEEFFKAKYSSEEKMVKRAGLSSSRSLAGRIAEQAMKTAQPGPHNTQAWPYLGNMLENLINEFKKTYLMFDDKHTSYKIAESLTSSMETSLSFLDYGPGRKLNITSFWHNFSSLQVVHDEIESLRQINKSELQEIMETSSIPPEILDDSNQMNPFSLIPFCWFNGVMLGKQLSNSSMKACDRFIRTADVYSPCYKFSFQQLQGLNSTFATKFVHTMSIKC